MLSPGGKSLPVRFQERPPVMVMAETHQAEVVIKTFSFAIEWQLLKLELFLLGRGSWEGLVQTKAALQGLRQKPASPEGSILVLPLQHLCNRKLQLSPQLLLVAIRSKSKRDAEFSNYYTGLHGKSRGSHFKKH